MEIRIASSSGPASQKRSISSSSGGAADSGLGPPGLAASFAEGLQHLVGRAAAQPEEQEGVFVEAFAEDVVDGGGVFADLRGVESGAFSSKPAL